MLLALTPNPNPSPNPLDTVFDDKPILIETYHKRGTATWHDSHFFGGGYKHSRLDGDVTTSNALGRFQLDNHRYQMLPKGASFEDAVAAASKLVPRPDALNRGTMPPVLVLGIDDRFVVSSIFDRVSTEGPWSPPLPSHADGYVSDRSYNMQPAELVRLEPLNPAVKAAVYHSGWFDLRNGAIRDAATAARAIAG